MATDTINNNLHVNGTLSARDFSPPAGSIQASSIASLAGIEATKLEHQYAFNHYQAPGSAIVAATQDVHIVRGATGDIIAFEAAVTGSLADHVDRIVTVQLHKSTAGGAFATVLTTPITLSSSDTIRVVNTEAVINTASLVDGDILRIVVTVAGASGNQAQGLIVTLTIREDAQ